MSTVLNVPQHLNEWQARDTTHVLSPVRILFPLTISVMGDLVYVALHRWNADECTYEHTYIVLFCFRIQCQVPSLHEVLSSVFLFP